MVVLCRHVPISPTPGKKSMKRILTFQKGKTPSGNQWVKQIRGKRHYFGPARTKSNKEDYLAAEQRYLKLLETLHTDEDGPPLSIKERIYGAKQTGRIARRFYESNQMRVYGNHFGARPKGFISAERARTLEQHVGIFVRWFGPDKRLSLLKSEDLNDFNTHLNELEYAHNTKAGFRASLKQFLFWAYQNEHLDKLPRSATAKISGPLAVSWMPTNPVVFKWTSPNTKSLSEIRKLYLSCRDHSSDAELFFLLATNCGFTQIDIATLEWDHLRRRAGNDWFIERPRHKTHVLSKHLLWDRTRELLLERKGNHPDLVVVTRTKKSHYRLNSRGSITSGIPETMKRIIKKCFGSGETRSFKHLRKTGASFCADRSAGTDSMYLAHSPSTMAAKHYSVATFKHLNRVLVAMESQFLGIPFNKKRHDRYLSQ